MPQPTSRRSLLALGGCLAVAGCLTDASNTDDTPTRRSATLTTDTPPTDTRASDTPATDTAIAADYRYDELSESERALIDQLRDRVVTRGIDELPELFFEVRQFTVAIEGTVYQVTVESDGYTADYALQTEVTSADDVSDDEEVVAYESLSANERELFRAALNEREYDERPPDLPEYVRYDGTTYHVVVVVADIPERQISMYEVPDRDD